MNRRFEQGDRNMNQRFDQIDRRLEQIERSINWRFEHVDSRLKALHADVIELRVALARQEGPVRTLQRPR